MADVQIHHIKEKNTTVVVSGGNVFLKVFLCKNVVF